MAEKNAISVDKVNYEGLNRHQKMAYFLVLVGPDSAAQILKDFDDEEIETVCREIAAVRIVERDIQRKIIDEFSSIIGDSVGGILGGSGFAQKALEKARGDYKAATIISHIAPVGSTTDLIEEVSDMEPRQIFNLMRYEQAQTIAFLISYLNPQKAADVISMLPLDGREEVVERIGSMGKTSSAMLSKVVKTLKKHIVTSDQHTKHISGGVRAVADLLNVLDKDISKTLLAKIEERNAQLGSDIRRKMFSFDDLIRISVPDLQRITREIEMADLVLALKSANQSLMEHLFKAVSKRAAETLKEELELLGPVKLKDVEAAQDRIIQVVRGLEDKGEISIESGGDRVIS
ncbi:MAG: flagellar motor switch protein FliG [Verrucomicrobia bacterium GWF2_51_19]|nr:MAG: flagellar motor switch protein FliG [Verrucomicrobia bacterium GWF2_51_19]HCJ12454.1 flagellar motor switch protein FliG [Opitutae bacterium]